MQKVLNYVATLGPNDLLFLSSLFMSTQSRMEDYKRWFGGCCSLGRFLIRRDSWPSIRRLRSTVFRMFQKPVPSAAVERKGLARWSSFRCRGWGTKRGRKDTVDVRTLCDLYRYDTRTAFRAVTHTTQVVISQISRRNVSFKAMDNLGSVNETVKFSGWKPLRGVQYDSAVNK